MKNVKKTAWTFVMVLAAAFLAVFVYSRFFEKTKIVTVKERRQYVMPDSPGKTEVFRISLSLPRIR